MNYYLRLAVGLLLLAVAGNSLRETINTLSSRRTLRTELAEISHVRYGILNADRWVEKIVPILGAQIDAIDLTATNRASLRPTVVKALNNLLDQVKNQLAPKPAPGAAAPAGFAAQAQAMIVNSMLAGLKPHIPEYADMVLRELGKPENKQALRDYIRSVVTDGARTTFGAVDMQWYNAILKQYGCADAATPRVKRNWASGSAIWDLPRRAPLLRWCWRRRCLRFLLLAARAVRAIALFKLLLYA